MNSQSSHRFAKAEVCYTSTHVWRHMLTGTKRDAAHGRWSAEGISLSKQVKAPILATVSGSALDQNGRKKDCSSAKRGSDLDNSVWRKNGAMWSLPLVEPGQGTGSLHRPRNPKLICSGVRRLESWAKPGLACRRASTSLHTAMDEQQVARSRWFRGALGDTATGSSNPSADPFLEGTEVESFFLGRALLSSTQG
jgi:hypothetical protein